VILFLAAPALALPTLLALRVDDVGGRRALTIITSGAMATPEVRREGDSLIVPLAASVPPSFVAPGPRPPLTDIGFERGAFGLSLRLRVARTVPYSVRQDGPVMQIVFGQEKSRATANAITPTAALFQSLFHAAPDPAVAAIETSLPPSANDPEPTGFRIGPIRLEPAIALNYWEGNSALGDTARSVKHRYLEVQPRLIGDLTLLQGRLKLSYEPRLRGYSSVPAVNQRSDRARVALDQPFGAFVLHADHVISTGILETTEVDPGREYFFRLGRFTRRQTTVGATLEPGGRIAFDLGASRENVNVDERAAFFDHETQVVRAAVDYELAPERKFALGYAFDRVPTPVDRPEAAMQGHTIEARLSGEILPLLRAEGSVGYRRHSSPNAAPGGRHFRGFVSALRLMKDFTPGAALGVSLGRSTPVSSFEGNGFYVTTSAQADTRITLPFALVFRAAAGRQRNTYQTLAAALGRPRDDRIEGWTVGLGRPFGRRAFLGLDYRGERRNSNLDEFDSEAHAVVFQFGFVFAPRSS
jgi:hypothetical protein